MTLEQAAADASVPLVGVVLAGGLSTRLGHDKVGLKLHGELGPDMLVRTAQLLANVTDEVWVSCRAGRCVDGPWYRLHDEEEGLGPFGGVMSALRAAQGPVMVLSCDLPFMEHGVLEKLVLAREARTADSLMTTYLQVETGFIESLVAIYEYEALAFFDRARAEGVRKLSMVVPPERRTYIPYEERDSLPFFNVNYPADLAMARRIIGAL